MPAESEETGAQASRNRLQTTTLLETIEEGKYDACIGGARRDERARAKSFFSHRDDFAMGSEDQRRAVEPLQRQPCPVNTGFSVE